MASINEECQFSGAHDDHPWLLRLLLSDPTRRFWSVGSLVLGLLGVATFALCASAAAGAYIAWTSPNDWSVGDEWLTSTAGILACLPLAGAYVAVLFALQLVGSCPFPITIRLLIIYSILFLSLAAVLGNFEVPVDPLLVVYATPFALGSFVQKRYSGWSALRWNQPSVPTERISIATLLDITAAIALTLWLVSISQLPLSGAGYLCFVPSSLICLIVGLHVWARLTCLSVDSSDRASGQAIWTAGNLTMGCLIWIVLVVIIPEPSRSLLGLAGAVLAVCVNYVYTEIPLRWLRACGWRFECNTTT